MGKKKRNQVKTSSNDAVPATPATTQVDKVVTIIGAVFVVVFGILFYVAYFPYVRNSTLTLVALIRM